MRYVGMEMNLRCLERLMNLPKTDHNDPSEECPGKLANLGNQHDLGSLPLTWTSTFAGFNSR